MMMGMVACGNVVALETSAGTDTVNSSQIGITAKVDAINAVTTASINDILNCQKSGKLFDPTTDVCIAVAEPLAKKIADCTTNKQFYNQNTGACQPSAPDLTTNLNDTNALLNKMIACNNAKQFFNSSTGTCYASGSAKVAISYSTSVHAKNGTKYSPYVTADYCSLAYAAYDFTGHAASCTVQQSGNQWRVRAKSNNSSCTADCQLVCYTMQ